jgi:NAD(P)-dependent dehydrogenase (short-subunit alcohol dehydrogenase family)
MLPLLRRPDAGRAVNMLSNFSSFAEHGDPKSYNYGKNLLACSFSKAALNAVTIQFTFELRNTPIKVNSAALGRVMTDMSGDAVPPEVRNPKRTVEQGAAVACTWQTLLADGPIGGFSTIRAWFHGKRRPLTQSRSRGLKIPVSLVDSGRGTISHG